MSIMRFSKLVNVEIEKFDGIINWLVACSSQ